MRSQQSVILFLLLLLFSFHGRGQDVSVKAVLDTNRGLIGDHFTLILQAGKPADWNVTFPAVKDTLSGKIEVLQAKPIDTAVTTEGNVLTQEFVITVFDTGLFEIPALQFEIRHETLTDTLKTLPVFVEILSMKADSTIRDIKGIYGAPLTFAEAAPFILAVVVLGLISWLLVRYIKKRRASETGKVMDVFGEPADVVAMRELAQLRDEKPWLNNRVKYFYSRISDILRTYIERRFHTLAMEQTTGEILQSLRIKDIEPSDLSGLSDILKLADLVKFAKVIPDPEQNALQIGQAEEFVRNTSAVTEDKITSEEILENKSS